ncbi:iron-containing redox enzyme family protein [Kitasatospora sp. NBC_00374]|uniref:iron-containing redox enzyme family protein n=1 Tax=Kitasatospora sp. NBC_00374 TaxID=2975964 RepID=UPI0032550BE3
MPAETLTPVPAGLRLRLLLDRLAPALAAVAAGLWDEGCQVDRYRAWLRTSHQVVRATTPLLAEAVQECLRREDPLSAELAPYFAVQLTEEHGHDRWLLDDYAATGADPAELLAAPPTPAVARFAGAPGYWIRHVHPLALLGHIALLEWYPPPAGVADRLAARTGLPAAAFRTLAAHAALDTGHGGALRAFLDSLVLTGAQHRLLLTAAATSADGLVDVLAPLVRPARRHPTEESWPTRTGSPSSASTSTTPATSSWPSSTP